MAKISLEQLIKAVEDIPPLPLTVTKALQVIDNPNSGPRDLANIIGSDQAMTVTLLKYANSAFYGLSRRVSTINEAIVIMGFAAIRSLLMSFALSKTLNREIKGYAMPQGEIWKHALYCGNISRHIAKKIKYPQPEEAFVAGLIHDIGKVVLNEFIFEDYQQVLQKVETEQKPFVEVEKEILGYSHAEAGALLGEKWKLPQNIVETIAYHHQPKDHTNKLVHIVHLADALCLMLGIGLGIDGLYYSINETSLQLLNLKSEQVELLIAEIDGNAEIPLP
ncbi:MULTISPECIES: HDOD domain-containing protein [Carboxydocella]|uniref:HDIG domain-containing protein n=2 Tax=Carboxydocella TaxID=178898 RepID=A0A1T4LL04_9FIRM|nr:MULTISPECIES: HDOD domain-containing protein [Carboxydocella]AVX20512.1 HDIG domain-containing protein [Carboxydocella thermautotrophica]GAW29670.1 HDIG domain-containing protein [Carboxydocella sp. ULO1]GAW31438.1 HDIG domain-containing protein [Carboxydocella sp. JDF658]SJZ55385.1 HDIG domain-containing protein [Carboxydocella sporoproducens DSM 16521]